MTRKAPAGTPPPPFGTGAPVRGPEALLVTW